MIEKKKQHICIFAPSAEIGGVERVMITLANGFVDNGHRVILIFAKKSGPMLNEVNRKVDIIGLGQKDWSKYQVLKSAFRLSKTLRKHSPDVLISANCIPNIVSIFASLLSRKKHLVILTEHNRLNLDVDSILKNLLVRIMYPASDAIVAVSHGDAQELQNTFKRYKKPIKSIPNPIDINRIIGAAGKSAVTTHKKPRLLSVGRLSKEKRHADLIYAFAQVRKQIDCTLEIVGDGPCRENLLQLIQKLRLTDSVTLAGEQLNPYGKIRDARILIVSSEMEGFGLVLVEAMALGTAVISTDCPHGPREILGANVWGRLVPIGDHEAMAAAILEEVRNPLTDKQNLVERSRTFGVKSAVEKYCEIFEKEFTNQEAPHPK